MKSNNKERRLELLTRYGGLCKLEHWMDTVKKANEKIVGEYYKAYNKNSRRSEIRFSKLVSSNKVIRNISEFVKFDELEKEAKLFPMLIQKHNKQSNGMSIPDLNVKLPHNAFGEPMVPYRVNNAILYRLLKIQKCINSLTVITKSDMEYIDELQKSGFQSSRSSGFLKFVRQCLVIEEDASVLRPSCLRLTDAPESIVKYYID
ncbi:unnamed protein product [Ambrosiozyma monospora]|uniref:Unnamed protein product n=1 Tax=Ambrosiozyma monospora TaxID=43982 RepID=A0ACB5U2D3_AMBMO|nr:unnamed protein product [Ambrosiozyma monospora]